MQVSVNQACSEHQGGGSVDKQTQSGVVSTSYILE